MDCDAFEVQVEQRVHGALPADQQAALAAHLEQCVRCRDFAALVSRIERQLVERVKGELSRVDWRHLDREVALQAVVVRWVLVGLGGFPLAALPWVVWRNLQRLEVLAFYIPFAVAIAFLCWRWRAHWLRQWERGSQEELLPFYRRWIDARIQDARQSIGAAVGAGVAIPAILLTWQPPQTLFDQLALAALPLVLFGSAVHLVAVQLPRLRREKQALG